MAKKQGRQINVTLTGESKRMFDWLRKYETDTYPTDAKAVAYLIKLGVEALKSLSAQDRDNLDDDTYKALSEYGKESLGNLDPKEEVNGKVALGGKY